MPKEGKNKSNQLPSTLKNDFQVETSTDERDDGEEHCRCCHCGAGQDAVRSQNYLKMREHLQQRLKAKSNGFGPDCDSLAGSRGGSIRNNLDADSELDSLVDFIEGHRCVQTGPLNPKKAAKKARQKQRKLEQQLNEEAHAEKKNVAPPQPAEVAEERIPNGMVRITHNPLTNSAVITPLYGPIEPNPSYLQQPMSQPQPQPSKSAVDSCALSAKVVPKPSVVTSSVTSSTSQPQQMVTIRRIMQPNLSEPVVTVTLKGETSDNDRVLFTMVNGQVIPANKSGSSSNSNSRTTTTTTPKMSVPTPPQPEKPAVSKKKQKKLERKKQKKLEKKEAENAQLEALSRPKFNQHAFTNPSTVRGDGGNDFTLDNFRLPPGITLTRVQGSANHHHPELPMRVTANYKDSSVSANMNVNNAARSNPIIVTSPLVKPKLKESSGGLSTPNVIVVDTRKIQHQQTEQHPPPPPPPRVQMQSVGVQTGEDDLLDDHLTKKQRKKQRQWEKKQQLLRQQENVVSAQMAALHINTQKPKKKTSSSTTTATTTSTTSTKKKKKKGAPQASEDKWEENIFVPKSDLDLERGDMDDDERELEAFKRFCFNTVPPERKEKVRIHLNVKDIFGKKSSSSNGLHSHNMTSCK